jgi:hypothetical protein
LSRSVDRKTVELSQPSERREVLDRIASLGERGVFGAEFRGRANVLAVRGDKLRFGVVPGAAADSIDCVDGGSPSAGGRAEVRAPRVVACAFGFRQRLAMRVGFFTKNVMRDLLAPMASDCGGFLPPGGGVAVGCWPAARASSANTTNKE